MNTDESHDGTPGSFSEAAKGLTGHGQFKSGVGCGGRGMQLMIRRGVGGPFPERLGRRHAEEEWLFSICCVPQGRWLTSLIKADSSCLLEVNHLLSPGRPKGLGEGALS